MDIFYSASTRGFYFKNIHGSNIPNDSLKIETSLYKSLQEGQKTGAVIVPDENGRPVLLQEQNTKADQVTVEEYWIEREMCRARDELEKVQDSDSKAIGSVMDWRNYRKSLRVWHQNENFPKIEFRPKAPDAE